MRSSIDSGNVLITGACADLGRQFARQLSRRARTLVLVSPSVTPLETLREELEALNPTLGVVLLPCDISQPSQVDAMLEELARHLIAVDVLVNAAAVGQAGPFARQQWADIDRMLQVNVMAPLHLIHRLLRPMLARRRGGILHIGSGVGRLFLAGAATPVGTHRCLDGFLESLRLEVEGTGVVITQAISGPLDEGEAHTGVRPFFQISAAQCAREALAGFERRVPLVYPGYGHHWVMTLLPMLPRVVRRVLGRLAARSLQRPSEQPVRALLGAAPGGS